MGRRGKAKRERRDTTVGEKRDKMEKRENLEETGEKRDIYGE
jgi:hypothetical protein